VEVVVRVVVVLSSVSVIMRDVLDP